MADNLLPSRAAVPLELWAERLSSAVNVGVVVLGSDQQIDFANARARTLLGAESDVMLEQRWLQLRHKLGDALGLRDNGAARAAEVAVTVRGDRARQDLRIQIYDIAEEDCTGSLLLIQPAERAQAMEGVLRHAAQDRALSSLFRDAAHDVKGLLNVITMNVEILARLTQETDTAPGRSDLAARCTTVLRRELARLDQSLAVVLDRRAVEGPPGRFDLRVTCRSLVELVSARARRQLVEVKLDLPDEPAEVHGFPDRVHAALLNLIVNALDAMPDGGALRLVVTPTPVVRIMICDTGRGVSSLAADEIWRLHHTDKPGGTGVGLHVTRQVVEAHGGRVSHRANPDGGACFVVELPTAQDHQTD